MEHASLEPRPQRLRASLLGGEALGVGGGPELLRPPLRPRALHRSEYARHEAFPMPLEHAFDPPDIAQVRAQPEDQPRARSTWVMPFAARNPAITVERWRTSRTSTSTRTSKKSC